MAELYPALEQRLAVVLLDPEEARDVAQEAFLRAHQAWSRFDGADPRAWLYTIGLRLAFNELRRRRGWRRALQRARPPAEWSPSIEPGSGSVHHQVRDVDGVAVGGGASKEVLHPRPRVVIMRL